MNSLRVVYIERAKCRPGRDCYELEVWDGNSDSRDFWEMTVEADGELRRVNLGVRGSFQAHYWPTR